MTDYVLAEPGINAAQWHQLALIIFEMAKLLDQSGELQGES